MRKLEYKYIPEQNFEDLACGRVLYHRTGCPNFPARLAGEVFMTCLELLGSPKAPVTLYDPCCGGAYMLTVLGFLCGERIGKIYASDISAQAVSLALQNLSLLTRPGLERRLSQLKELLSLYGKSSHREAIESAGRLMERLGAEGHGERSFVFQADMMGVDPLKTAGFQADVVFTDVPYGNLVSWSEGELLAVNRLLDALVPVLKRDSVIAVASNKAQKLANPRFLRVKKLTVGKRKVEFFRLCEGAIAAASAGGSPGPAV